MHTRQYKIAGQAASKMKSSGFRMDCAWDICCDTCSIGADASASQIPTSHISRPPSLCPHILSSRRYPFEEAAEGFRVLLSREVIGKVVLIPNINTSKL